MPSSEEFMRNEKVVASVRGGVAELQLNKPAKLNALDEEMLLAIEKWFGSWEAKSRFRLCCWGRPAIAHSV